jgi:hypothetical protein
MTSLLVVSSDTKWVEYLQLELESVGIKASCIGNTEQAFAAVRAKPSGHFNGVLISALAAPRGTQNEAALDATDLLTALRQEAKSDVPILLWSPFPAERLSRIASRFERTTMISSDTAAAIKSALHGAAASRTSTPSFAKVELEIGATGIRLLVAIEGKGVITEIVHDWVGRKKLARLEDKFIKWPLWQRNGGAKPRLTDGWLEILKETGEDLADELRYSTEELSTALVRCVEQVGTLDMIYFRFSLLSAGSDAPYPYVHVPFELLYDTAKKNFIRALAPVARRICLSPASRTAMPLGGVQSLLGPVLFIKSDAHGSHTLRGSSFNGQTKLTLPPLLSLDDEFQGVCAARAASGRPAPALLELAVGQDTSTLLRDTLLTAAAPGPQILHYAGHTIQTDDGGVYLILPGREPGQLLPLPISEFARWSSQAKPGLVLLSSCSSSTPDAVFRVAQAGIPAVIGFRWEVNDGEAGRFTQHLHGALAGNVPLARAFHGAVGAVRSAYPDSPTFASATLIVQNEEWTV